jgi:hypothetical protein
LQEEDFNAHIAGLPLEFALVANDCPAAAAAAAAAAACRRRISTLT